jgi:hypothetical protein
VHRIMVRSDVDDDDDDDDDVVVCLRLCSFRFFRSCCFAFMEARRERSFVAFINILRIRASSLSSSRRSVS